jgi:uncharacterized protein
MAPKSIKSAELAEILGRIKGPRRFIQVLLGPRQTGKTTMARKLLEAPGISGQYATADEPLVKGASWIEQQWQAGRLKAGKGGGAKTLLVLDEIQKIPGWSETVKRLWDEDSATRTPLQVLVLGSSPWLMQNGLTESLAGRFEVIHVTHWNFAEMQGAFRWGLDRFLFFGGYPGAAALVSDVDRWRNYLLESIIETTLSRDILLSNRIEKPVLLRRLFELGCHYSGQVLSYQKILGQLQDKGNTTTLAHYLTLLSRAGMLTGLEKFAGQKARQRASSPKLLVLNTGLISAITQTDPERAKADPEFWGRLTESAVGNHLVNASIGTTVEVQYWAEGNAEVDFVLVQRDKAVLIEVKSSRTQGWKKGPEAFAKHFPVHKQLLVGNGGMPLEEFLTVSPEELF